MAKPKVLVSKVMICSINYKQLWPMGGDLWAMAKPTVLVSNVMICVLLLSKNKMEYEITAFKLYTTYIIHE